MLLTNSKQIVLLKMEQSSIFQLLLSDIQLTEDTHNECDKSRLCQLGVETEEQRRVREMENSIFEEPTEIFKLLNESENITVDGLTYREIQQSQELASALELIRGNAPIYQHLNKRKKVRLMNEISLDYVARLNSSQPFKVVIQADQHRNLSQNQCEVANFSPEAKLHKSGTIKKKPVSKIIQNGKNGASNKRLSKKVRFSSVSFCKYFCSMSAPKKIRQSQINSIQTF